MDSDTTIRIVWLVVGLVIGYGVGAATTAVRLMRIMSKELHECHVALYDKKEKPDAQ